MIFPQEEVHDVALVSQMRAGTHYMCAALRVALEAQMMRPRNDTYAPMDDADILKDMHPDGRFDLPPPRPNRHVYFSHYYHSQFRSLPSMPHLSLIGFPLDSFYSDGVVFGDVSYSAGPSALRTDGEKYVLRYGSREWVFLEDYMHKNAQWLDEIGQNGDLVVRYEDLSLNFDETATKISSHVGGFLNPLPKPVINRKRSYWARDYTTKFDKEALAMMTELFGHAISRYYPEHVATLRSQPLVTD